jgi:hypothetical protein
MTRRSPPTNDEIDAATCWNSMAVADIDTYWLLSGDQCVQFASKLTGLDLDDFAGRSARLVATFNVYACRVDHYLPDDDSRVGANNNNNKNVDCCSADRPPQLQTSRLPTCALSDCLP